MDKEVIKVGGMSCGHCVATIEKSLGALHGVEKVQVSLEQGIVEVEFNSSSTSLESIKETIDEVGFEVV